MPTFPLKFTRASLLVSLALATCLPAMAQTATVPPAPRALAAGTAATITAPTAATTAPAIAPGALGISPGTTSFYQELGGKDGIAAIVAEFVAIMTADKRINGTFEGVDLDRLRAKVAEQFCAVSGGPCSYTGKSMAESHEDLKVNNAQFNASVENLQLALERRGVPSRVQNRLLARLAPTQREIVTK